MVVLNGALPSFDLDQGGPWLALARGLSVASLLSLFGTLVFAVLVAPRALSRAAEGERAGLRARLRSWTLHGLEASIFLLLVWIPLQAADIAGTETLPATCVVVPEVMRETRFGQLVMLQLAGLLILAVWLRRRGPQWVAMLLAGLVLALHVGHTHAASMVPLSGLLLASDIVHLLAGGAWLGGLLPLWLMVRHAEPRVGTAMCRFYSPLGKYCVVAVLATAIIQFSELIGGFAGLVGTAYGWMALVKMALFGMLFGFACLNRYRLAPALIGADTERARRTLQRSIAWQTVAALAVVLAAGVLSQLSPSMHTQPVWPFAEQFSLVTVQEDAEFRAEVLRALAMLALAVLIAGAGLVWRRRWFGWLAILIAIPLAAAQGQHLDLLFIPATPMSFYRSPTGFSADSIAAGAALYPQHCASCHGSTGKGDGPLAAKLPVPPADLTAPHLWGHTDGELFGWLHDGIENPEGGLSMPGFGTTLDDDQIWALIDFIRARNPSTPHDKDGNPVMPEGMMMQGMMMDHR